MSMTMDAMVSEKTMTYSHRFSQNLKSDCPIYYFFPPIFLSPHVNYWQDVSKTQRHTITKTTDFSVLVKILVARNTCLRL